MELTNVSDKKSLNEFNEVPVYREFHAVKIPKIKKVKKREKTKNRAGEERTN